MRARRLLCGALMVILALLLCACGAGSQRGTSMEVVTTLPTTEEPTTQALPPRKPIAPFEDYDISMAAYWALFQIGVERDKSPFTKKELGKLAQRISLHVNAFEGESLADLPKYFPNLRHLEIGGLNSREKQLSIAELGLQALTTGGDIDPALFADLPYLNIISGVDSEDTPIDINLAKHSVLGEEYIKGKIDGILIEYLRVNNGGRVYELFVKAPGIGISKYNGEEYLKTETEAWLFISKRNGQGYTCVDSYGPLPRYAYYNGIRGGLVLADANFDGREDILVLSMLEGSESRPYYHALLRQPDGKYKLCESFGMIPHPELNAAKKTVRGGARGNAGEHYWELYAYKNDEFVQTKSLHTAFVQYKAPDNYEEEIYRYTVQKIAADGSGYDKKEYLSSDYSQAQWERMFYDDSNAWALASEQWLYINGARLDIIHGPVPEMVMKVISDS